MKTGIWMVAALMSALGVAVPQAQAATGQYWEVTTRTEISGMSYPMPDSTEKVCLTDEQASDPRQAQEKGDQDCRITDMKRSGNKSTWKMNMR